MVPKSGFILFLFNINKNSLWSFDGGNVVMEIKIIPNRG